MTGIVPPIPPPSWSELGLSTRGSSCSLVLWTSARNTSNWVLCLWSRYHAIPKMAATTSARKTVSTMSHARELTDLLPPSHDLEDTAS